jgi:hypothetical protein
VAGAVVLLLFVPAYAPLWSLILDGNTAAVRSGVGAFPLFGLPGVYTLLGGWLAVIFVAVAFNRYDEERRNGLIAAACAAVFALLSLHRPNGEAAVIAFRVVGFATWFLAIVTAGVLLLSPLVAPFLVGKQPPKAKLPEGGEHGGPYPKPGPAAAPALPNPQTKARPALAAKPDTKALPSPTKHLPAPDNRKRLG